VRVVGYFVECLHWVDAVVPQTPGNGNSRPEAELR
jgi:hypothetical protein